MKRSTLVLALIAAMFVGIGCTPVEAPGTPNVTSAAVNEGATLRLTWTEVTDAESYEITAGDSVYTTTSTSYDVTVPVKRVEVRAVNGGEESDPAVIDLSLVETSSIVLYGITDPNPDHPSGLAFSADGTASALSLSDANKPAIDYVCDDENMTPVGLVNAGDYSWPQNTKLNTAKDAGTTDFDAYDEADASGYTTQQSLANNGLYALWLSTSQTWTANDHFAKAKVVSIEDVGGVQKVTLRIAYQKVGGLRWLVTP